MKRKARIFVSRKLRPVRKLLPGFALLAVLPACEVTMGPPPASDPPLVQESQKQPPPPAQPTEPQAWSRDLDFDDGGEQRVRKGELADGLVAAEEARSYSGEQLTFRSAENSERPPTEAELIRQRARERLEAANAGSAVSPAVAAPEVVAAPVEQVSAEALPDQSSGSASRPPAAENSPPNPATPEPALTEPALAEPTSAEPVEAKTATSPAAEEATAGSQTAALPNPELATASASPQPAEKLQSDEKPQQVSASDAPAAEAIEVWDAPEGTILVQISAIQNRQEIAGEWERLKNGYPGVLGPLRLVVEEAKLGERGVFFRVQAGGFESQADAEAACLSLTGRGQPCFVVERSSDG